MICGAAWACLERVLELLEGLLLHHLRVFEALNQLKLLNFHLLDRSLVLKALRLLACHFIMHLLSSPHFLIEMLFFLFVLGLLLLLFDEVLDHVGLGHVLVVLMIK